MKVSKKGHFLFLGTGGSMGVPVIGCGCAVCSSKNPHDKRLRAAGILSYKNKRILIDPGPDFRHQALRAGVTALDGVIITHTHYDHIGGIDELRIFFIRAGKPLPCLVSRETYDALAKRYDYLFTPQQANDSLTAQFDFHILDKKQGDVIFCDIPMTHMEYFQGSMGITGIRVEDFAYISDIRDYPDTIFQSLQGVNILVLGALRHTSSYLHFSVEEAIEFARAVGAEQTWLTHIAHEVDHETTQKMLPPQVQLSFDGMELKFG
ncbi:MBL fold metallo-hydrolase [Simkania negevensis]|uniref:MBL fold metallo-hydrolase n=1 Tax=Simkania negevensis TaxID=83561 RepID=A0ABS3AQ07_9BACT|nr:MBL fold metallo-hydrolase [Simkania negevensis]